MSKYKIWVQAGSSPTIPPSGQPACTVPITWNEPDETCSWSCCDSGYQYSGSYSENNNYTPPYYSGLGPSNCDGGGSTTAAGSWVAQSSGGGQAEHEKHGERKKK